MIYKLDYDLSHISEEGVYDASLIRFDGWQNLYFSNTEADYRGRVPDPLEFVGDLEILARTDLPYNSRRFPLMSWKLLLALLSVAPFEYRTYPARIYSETVADQVRFTSSSARTDAVVTDPALYTDQFVLVQLLGLTDALDQDRTIYAQLVGDRYEPRRASEMEDKWSFIGEDLIERLVLKVPEDELPGLFQFPQTLSLLCTERGVQACQQAGVVGAHFTPLPVPLAQSRLDLPEWAGTD